MTSPRLLYVVTEDWYFLSHRLPMARAAMAAGYEVHVATRLNSGKAAIEAEGFTPPRALLATRQSPESHSFSGVMELRRLLRDIKPDILHNIALKPVLLGSVAALGSGDIAVVNSLTGLGTLFIGEARVSGATRRLVRPRFARSVERKAQQDRGAESRRSSRRARSRRAAGKHRADPWLGCRHRLFHDRSGAAASGDRGLCGPHACRQGRVHAHQCDERGCKPKAPNCNCYSPAIATRRIPGSLAPEQLREFANTLGINWLGHVTDIRDVWARADFAVFCLTTRRPAEEPIGSCRLWPSHGSDRCARLPRDRNCGRDCTHRSCR